MKAEKLTVERIFDRTERLEAPLFQRPYVWRREPNWLPLWEGIQAVAEKRLAGQLIRPHFLGTIVLDQLGTQTGKIHARQIIDGQQRLTTLQLALAAARDLCKAGGQDRYYLAFKQITDNHAPLCDDPDAVFKVWPTNADREDFRQVMVAGTRTAVRELPHADPADEWLIPDAYVYFSDNFAKWLGPPDSEAFSGRLETLYASLKEDLHTVVIDLEENDDAQEIFETLNALGTPLLPADLVKNYLFRLAESQKKDTPGLYRQYWEAFDSGRSYWRHEVRQGRLKRPRLDLFLTHYLTLMTGEDVGMAHLFAAYRDFVQTNNDKCAATHMGQFRAYADVYRSFDEYAPDSREGLFFYRLTQMDTSTILPLLLEVFKRYGEDRHHEERHQVLLDLESFLVRRAICELTTKNYNKFFADMAKTLKAGDDFSPAAIRKALLAQTADISRWPDDTEFKNSWLTINFSKRIKTSKARMILEAIEAALHTGKTEKVQLEHGLTIEHLMPKKWEEHWPPMVTNQSEEAKEKAARFRGEMLHKVGNLTLLTRKLNPSVSNGPWKSKRPEILKHSALNLNRTLPDTWNEMLINERSEELFKVAVKVWPRPDNG